MSRVPATAFVLALALAAIIASTTAAADCRERLRLDAIFNVDPVVWEVADAPDNPVDHLYDIIGPWAVAVAIGDYDGAALLSDGIAPEVELLADALSAEPVTADQWYVRALVHGSAARIALVGHHFVVALRHGLAARDAATTLASRWPQDPRADFFLGLYQYYTGIAPAWLRAVGAMAGISGDAEQGLQRLEAAVASGQPLAVEAARVLLEETAGRHRPACRYLPLATQLADRYPDNFRFAFYREREDERCGGAEPPAGAPVLPRGCYSAGALDLPPARP